MSNTSEIKFFLFLYSVPKQMVKYFNRGILNVQHSFCCAMEKVAWVFGLEFEYLYSNNFIKLDIEL